jgi:Phage tail assembly chaperone protein, TAC
VPHLASFALAGFAPAATRLAGLATLLLGWTPDQFWAATPAELGAILAAMADVKSGSMAPFHTDAAPPDAAHRARLMEMFPDAQG